MSCFMVGDRIRIYTRKDCGRKGTGEPLLVEINGLSGIVVLRQGADNQTVGTTIEIVGRRKPSFLTKYEDTVRLLAALDGYALATEFPICGRCTVPEFAGEVQIPPEPTVRRTRMEKLAVSATHTIEVPFSAVAQDLGGCIRASFMVDNRGVPVLRTAEAEWGEVGSMGTLIANYQRNRANFLLSGEYLDVYNSGIRRAFVWTYSRGGRSGAF